MFDRVINSPPLSKLRRNHALEHATLNMLARNKRYLFLAGYSDVRGFWIIGNVDADDLQQAIEEALKRLRNGEHALAISQNCGTNYAVSGIFAGVAAWLATLSNSNNWRRKLDRLPMVIVLATLALMIARPLGPLLQENVTTLSKPGSLHVTGVNIYNRKGVSVHRVLTSLN